MSGGASPFDTPEVALALAGFAGVTAQVAARHVGLPGIVLLLGTGVALGPDGANLIRPESLGSTLQTLVGFAVAVILFEGALALNLNRLARAQKPVRRLVTIGAVATMVVGTLVAKVAMGWPWQICILFGTLIIVTGPTVVTPLLRRLQVEPRVATVLEAEGVLIDAVGAITAAVALEVALNPASQGIGHALIELGSRLSFGVIAGIVAGGALALVLGMKNAIPEGYENIFALTFVLALFQITNAVFHESGIAAATAAGIVLARTKLPAHHDLHHFKEQLTSMLIGLLFILLAADVRLENVRALGWRGVAVIAGVLLVVRPINVAVGTFGSALSFRQRMFIAWIGPRGIIAAAVASLFAGRLAQEGMTEGQSLQAVVFGVIAVSVLWAGLTGGFVAQWLGLRRPSDTGWVILGGNELALAVANSLREAGEAVLIVESDPDAASQAEREGHRTIFANAFEQRTIQRTEMSSRTGVLALTMSEETNYLFGQRAKKAGKAKKVLLALDTLNAGITESMLTKIGAEVWTGAPTDVGKWAQRLRLRQTGPERWRVTEAAAKLTRQALEELVRDGLVLPLTLQTGDKVGPFGAQTALRADDQLFLLLSSERREEARAALETRAFERIA